MGVSGQSITLANSIIGVGILAMPFCFQQCGILLATLILLSMGLVSRLCCHFLLKSALLARRRNFEFLAFHVFGPAGKMAVEVGIIGFLMGTCIAYFVVVGDLGPQIISKMLNVNQSDILRTSIMVVVSLVCVLPLGLLRNVDSLSNVSAATICFYFCLVIKVLTEATSQLLSAERAWRVWRPAGVLQCVPIFSMALFCQTQLFEIFESMPTLSLEKMNLVTKNAINICTAVYFTLGLFGYIAFCSQDISGNILMSLSPTLGSDVIKLGFVMSLAFSFPLIIFPCRASLYSFLYKQVHSSHHDHMINHSIPQKSFRCITVGIIAVSLCIGLLVPNIELVLGLVGSTIGVLVCVVFPAACFVNVTFKNTNERILAKVVIILGLIIMVLGTYANLQAAETKHERYDDKYITQERIDQMVEEFFQKKDKIEPIVPAPEAEILPDDAIKLVENNVRGESEVQPPNPVPPDTSKEHIPVIPPVEIEKPKQIPDILKVNGNKKPESHPRDVKTKLNEAIVNGGNVKEEKKIEINKVEEIQTIEEVNKIDPKQTENEDKERILKQQELIETIKKHGEEQKELVKEQKEIIDELLKNKKEEKDSIEEKKVDVKERIDIPLNPEVIPEKPVDLQKAEKIANEAIQKIDQRAEEALKAIEAAMKIENKNNQNPTNVKPDYMPIAQNIPNAPNVPIDTNVEKEKLKEVPQNSAPIVNELNKLNNPVPANPQPAQPINQDINKLPNPQPKETVIENKKPLPETLQKPHSHSPDEPQSYKQGEDKNAQILKNIPIPLAMNEKAKKPKLNENIQNNPIRQKRNVIDCSNKASLKIEDKEFCDSLDRNQNILPQVDLNDALSNRMPIDDNVLRVGRSLKHYEETKGR